MAESWDAVVVGAGPNGLCAAATLGRAGWRVLVVEAAETIGGGTRSGPLTLDGFVHDRCSAVHPLAVASPALRALDLRPHGVEWLFPEIQVAHPLDGGRAGLVIRSVEDTAAGLGLDDGPVSAALGAVGRRSREPDRGRPVAAVGAARGRGAGARPLRVVRGVAG